MASDTILELSQKSKNDIVRLNASKDILDRGGFSPAKELNNRGSITVNLIQYNTDRPAKDIIEGVIKDTITEQDK